MQTLPEIETSSCPQTRPQEAFSRLSTDCRFHRPTVKGKFLSLANDKLWVRGGTYGAFRPDANGNEYHDLEGEERDFCAIAANGLNAVRIPHTMPPSSLLDTAQRHGLHVMVGLSAEQYVGFLIDKKGAPDIAGLVRAKVRACAGHSAILCYAIGNEIPASVVRWLGHRRVERYLELLYRAIKAEDPDGLVTYVNYPTTGYLQLPFLDLDCFNVYLESQDRFRAYIARLQNLVGDRPLLMSAIGLDSLRHGHAPIATGDARMVSSHHGPRPALDRWCPLATVAAVHVTAARLRNRHVSCSGVHERSPDVLHPSVSRRPSQATMPDGRYSFTSSSHSHACLAAGNMASHPGGRV